MKTKKLTFKNTICLILSFVLLVLSGVGIVNITKSNNIVYGATEASLKKISNSNFDENSHSYYPYKPSSYNYVDKNFNTVEYDPQSSSSSVNVKAGVISLEHKDYETVYPLNPNSSDKKVLMIKNDKSTSTTFGVQSTTEIELKAGSNYSISADVLTTANDGTAALYLVDENGDIFAEFKNLNSYNRWTPYTFFIKTNTVETVKVKLTMFLDGEGAVLFDNLSAYELNDQAFTNRQAAYSNEQIKLLNLETGYIEKTIPMAINTFKAVGSTSNITSTLVNSIALDAELPNGEGNSTALKFAASQSANATYETGDDFLTFKPNAVYNVSVNLKSTNLKGKVNLKLIQTNLNEDETGVYSDALSISSKTESAINNNYQNFSFIVKTHPTKTLTYKLQLAFELEDACTTYISQVQISKSNNAAFSSSSTYVKPFNIASKLVANGSEIMLDNGNFNGIEIEDALNPFPAKATSWSVTTGDNLQYYGVVNTSQFDELKTNKSFSNLINPQSPSGSSSNNILMMYNSKADSLSYTSATKSLDAKTYHKFSLKLLTQNSAAKVSLVSIKDDKQTVLASKEIDTNYDWTDVDFFLYTGYQSLSVAVKIELNSTQYAYAYVDDCMFNYFSQPTSLYANSSADVIIRTDLTNIITTEQNSNSSFTNAPLYFNITNDSNIEVGVMNLDDDYISTIINPAMPLANFTSLTNRNIIGVRAIDYANLNLTSSIGYELSAGKFYTLSVKVYTQNLESENKELTGAVLKLTNFEQYFDKIVTESEENNNWKTYTFYLNPKDKVTTNLVLELGNSETVTKGDVFFGDIEFTELAEGENFDNVTESETIKILTDTTLDDEEEEEDESKDDESTTNSNAWIFYIPTILTGLAILIAVVGVVSKKIRFKKPVKKSKTEYDRNKTVSKQVSARKATMYKESKLRELNKELDTLHADRAKYEEEYKHNLTKLRELKIKRASQKEISALEKDIKKNQKITSSIGMNILKLQADIDHVNSDSYFKALMRKIETDPTFIKDSDEDNK